MARLRRIVALLIFLLLVGWSSPPLAAQGTPATLVLPNQLAAGQPATLAVLDAEGRLVPGANVEFAGGVTFTTDATGRAVFTAPAERGVMTARLPGGAAANSTVLPASDHPENELVIDRVPGMVAVNDRFSVGGFGFRGEADANRALLGEQAAVVLAASPLELILIANPGTAPGATQLQLQVGERQTEAVSLTLVGFELTAEREQLAPKEKGNLTIRVLGTWQRLELEARNLTPEVVKLKNGNVQRVLSSGGNDNLATLALEGRRAGAYSISVWLVPRPSGLPDTETALRHLLQAVRLAPNEDLRERITRQIHRLERHPQDVGKVRLELERILGEDPSGPFGTAVEAAWKALLKR